MNEPLNASWTESDSTHFIDVGRIYTPRRDDIANAFCDLIPAAEDEPFTAVEAGTGSGWLSESILTRYPESHIIGLDGSEAMRKETHERLQPFEGRFEVRLFRLEDRAWIDELPNDLRCVVSSLVIHHLDGPGKAALFRDLYSKLAPGGALLICDLVAPANRWGRRHYARSWNAEVERQSREIGGNDRAHRQFVDDRWNIHEFPVDEDDIDHPSPTLEQLAWLAEAGFTGVDVFWARAGHALLGGYKP